MVMMLKKSFSWSVSIKEAIAIFAIPEKRLNVIVNTIWHKSYNNPKRPTTNKNIIFKLDALLNKILKGDQSQIWKMGMDLTRTLTRTIMEIYIKYNEVRD